MPDFSQARSTQLDVCRLARGATVFVWDSHEAKPGRPRPFIAGEPLKPPFACLSLPLSSGGARHLMVAPTPRLRSFRSAVLLDRQGGKVAEARPTSSESAAIVDFCIETVSAGTERIAPLRIVWFLTQVCSGMFRLGDDADFVAICRRMIGALSRSPGVAHGRCRVYDGMIWCETLVPVALGDIVGVCLLGPGFVRRVTARPLLSPGPRNRESLRVCRLLLDCGTAASGPMMVTLFGESGVACRRLTASPRRLPALSELVGQQPAWLRGARRDVIQALATLSAGDPRATLLVRK